MKKIQKVISVLLAVGMTVSICTSCGKKNKAVDDQGRTVISVADWPQKEGESLDLHERLKAEFEAENPDVVIERDSWSFDLKTFYPKAEAGLLPTVFGSGFTEVDNLVNGGYTGGLSEVLDKRGYTGKFNEKVLELLTRDGEIHAFPWSAYVLGMAYNVDLFEKAGLMNSDGTPKQPKTWNEVVEFAKIIKEKTGKAGFMIPTSNNMGGWMFMPIAWSYGAEFMEKNDDGSWTAKLNTPEVIAALQFIKDMKWEHGILPDNTLIDSTEYYKTYATGGVGMMMAADVTAQAKQYDMNIDHIGMMAMPAGPVKNVTLLGGSIICVADNATDEQKDAAVRWWEKRGWGVNLDDISRKTIEDTIKTSVEEGKLVGIKSMSPWNDGAEITAFKNEMIDKYANSNINHVRLYNDFVESGSAEIKPEEPMCCQDLYGVLDNCIQKVLSDKDADCAQIMEKANSDFQTNFLDNVDY